MLLDRSLFLTRTMGILVSFCIEVERYRLSEANEVRESLHERPLSQPDDEMSERGEYDRPDITLPPIQMYWQPAPGPFAPSDGTIPFDLHDLANGDLYSPSL